VAVDGLEPTYSVLRSPLLPDLVDETCADGGPVLVPCRLWGNSDRDGDVSGCLCLVCRLLALLLGSQSSCSSRLMCSVSARKPMQGTLFGCLQAIVRSAGF
jgi:hypothetical protein